MRFRSYLDGSTHFMGPETSMEVQTALRSDIALVFDECTPFHGGREYTARSTERTHRWLDRCLDWQRSMDLGSGCVRDRPGRRRGGPAPRVRAGGRRARLGGIAIGGTLGEDKDQMFAVVEWTIEELPEASPATCSASARSTTWSAASGRDRHLRLRDADPDRPPRHGRRPRPGQALARRSRQGALEESDEPTGEGCPCPSCEPGYCRAYLHYLFKAQEQTAMRLLTIHNLAYLQS